MGNGTKFIPKTEKIRIIHQSNVAISNTLSDVFSRNTNVYIDYANVRPWMDKLGWHIDLKRLKQFFDSFTAIQSVNFYYGTIDGDSNSEKIQEDLEKSKYAIKTKPVKKMKFSIDISSISPDSIALLDQFIRRVLLKKYSIETIEYLNNQFKIMNANGIFFIEDRKCNFDVEIGVDMLLDAELHGTEVFVLWSGDSDFVYPVKKLLEQSKKVILFATARKVSKELSDLSNVGLYIFEIKKIKNFICRNKEMDSDIIALLQQKGFAYANP